MADPEVRAEPAGSQVTEYASSRWKATSVVMFGGFLSIFSIAIVNIVLPEIMAAFGANVEKIKWVITAYMISLCVLMPTTGWLAGTFGHRNLYIGSLSVFTIGSLLCGVAWSPDSLIFFRIIQGLGGGILMPITMALLLRIFPPHQRGLAMGIWGLANSIGGSLGPTAGGFITEYMDWRFIFFINVFPGTLGIFLSFLTLKPDADRERSRLDLPGFATMAAAMISLLIALSQGQIEGWNSVYIIRLFAIFAVAFLSFIIIEQVVKEPLVDLSVYLDVNYLMAAMVSAIVGFGLYGSSFLVPLFMVNALDYSVLQTAIAWLPGAAVVIITAQVAGRLSDRIDPRTPLTIGILVWAGFVHLFGGLDLRASYLAVTLIVLNRGIALGMSLPPINVLAMSTLPPRKITMAAGLINLTFTMGGMFGIALLGSMLERQELTHYSIYAEGQELSSHATYSTIKTFQNLFLSLGYVGEEMRTATLATLKNIIGMEALVTAFQDCFNFLALFFLLSLIPLLFINCRKRRTIRI